MFRLVLLGGLRLEDETGPVTGRASQKRRLGLLALLAVPPGRLVTRDKLVGYLWPERDDERARRLLSTALYDLRQDLGEDVIRTPGDEIGLDPAVITSDAAEFLAALEAGDYEAAVELYGGPFLEASYIGAGPEFEHWVDGERQRYARKYCEALEKLATARDRAGDRPGAVELWNRLAVQDPCAKRVAMGYIRALVANGERARALAFADVHVAMLRETYEAEPDPEVVAFVDQLRKEPARPSTPAEEPGATVPVDPALSPASDADAADVERAPSPTSTQVPAPVSGPVARMPPATTRRPSWLAAGMALALVALALMLWAPWTGDDGVDVIRLAVLPPETEPGEGTDYFARGLAEALITNLGQLDGFTVRGHSSSFAYTDPSYGDPRIARELDVEFLLRISMSGAGDEQRVFIDLTDAAGDHFWGDQYYRREGGEPRFQETIVRDVVDELRPRLAGPAPSVPADRPLVRFLSDVPEANLHYTNARGHWLDRTPEGLEAARDELELAISIDADFARAYAGLADVYNTMGAYAYAMISPDSAGRSALAAARTARRLESELPEAHAALGVARFNYEWDLAGAETALREAIRLYPGDSMTRHWYSLLLRVKGDTAGAMSEITEAQGREPRSAVIATSVCQHRYFAHQYGLAREACGRAVTLDSLYAQSHLLRGLVAVQLRDPETAIAAYDRAAERVGRPAPATHALEAHAMGTLLGETAAARTIYDGLADARARYDAGKGPYVGPQFLTVAALGAGLEEMAIEWLGVALEERNPVWVYLGLEPLVDPLRDDPAFQELVGRARGLGLAPVFRTPAAADR